MRNELLDLVDFETSQNRIRQSLPITPFYRSHTLSAITGCNLSLKCESFQFTSSFKERGALNKLLQLSPEQKANGVIAMSAGNHAQAVARHAQELDIRAVIVMPRTTPVSKIEQTKFFKCEVVLEGQHLTETFEYVFDRQERENLTLIHPYDDPAIIAGQGSVALEMFDQGIEFDTVVVPIGGGGLISGISQVIKLKSPNTRIVGVQAEGFSGAYTQFKHVEFVEPNRPSVAEGIAVKMPSQLTMSYIERNVDEIVTVTEEQIEDALFLLLDLEKILAEGAGAASLAATLNHDITSENTAVVVSGGNIDMTMLTTVLQRGLVRTRRVVQLHVEIQDIPGSLAKLTTLLSAMDSNIIEITHKRMFGQSSLGSTICEVILQIRGKDQLEILLERLNQEDYHAKVIEP